MYYEFSNLCGINSVRKAKVRIRNVSHKKQFSEIKIQFYKINESIKFGYEHEIQNYCNLLTVKNFCQKSNPGSNSTPT